MRRRAAAPIAALLAAGTPPAAGAATPPAASGVVAAVSACRAIAANEARLACYDAAAGRLQAAQTSGEVVVVDREQVRKVRRQAFGFQLPSLAMLTGAGKDDAMERLTAVIDHASQTVGGRWLMVTQDGAAWVQNDSQEIGVDPHRGSTLVVAKGVLGSFFCKIDGQSAVRCKRQS